MLLVFAAHDRVRFKGWAHPRNTPVANRGWVAHGDKLLIESIGISLKIALWEKADLPVIRKNHPCVHCHLPAPNLTNWYDGILV